MSVRLLLFQPGDWTLHHGA